MQNHATYWNTEYVKMNDGIETHILFIHYPRASRAARRLSRQSPDVTHTQTHSERLEDRNIESERKKETTLVSRCLFKVIAV